MSRSLASAVAIFALALFATAVPADEISPLQHFRDLQAAGGSDPEQRYLQRIGGATVPATTNGGSLLDLQKQDRQSMQMPSGNTNLLTISNAASALEGRKTAACVRSPSYGVKETYYVSGGYLYAQPSGQQPQIIGTVESCLRYNCFISGPASSSYMVPLHKITRTGVEDLLGVCPWIN